MMFMYFVKHRVTNYLTDLMNYTILQPLHSNTDE